MAAGFDVQSLNIDGGCGGEVASGEMSISCVARVEECLRQLCKRKGRFVVFLHADLRSDGLILLLDREVRRNVRWRGSDTGSWGCPGFQAADYSFFLSGQ
jgi:hypothetical protein